MTAALYIVSTPIGNLGDISARARQVLAEAAVIAAEDTRHSGRLLQHLGITTPLRAYHDFSTAKDVAVILRLLAEGKPVALISDAGTPLIADPGFRLVQAARNEGYPVIPVPGPSAFLAALSVSGLPTDRFVFEGFLPEKPAARRRRLQSLRDEPRTLIFYETPHRILPCLQDMLTVIDGAAGSADGKPLTPAAVSRQLFTARELTKKFETHHLGTIASTIAWLQADPQQQQGEFVLVLAGASEAAQATTTALQKALAMAPILQQQLGPLPPKKLATVLAHLTNTRKNKIYRALNKH